MKRILYALLVGVVGAGILHIAILTLLPAIAAEESWDRLRRSLPPYRIGLEGLPVFSADPFLRTAACRFDLREGAVRLRASGPVAAWFLSVYGPDGSVLASLNDQSVPGGIPDFLLLTPEQRAATGASPAPTVPIEVDAEEALAVLKVFTPDASWSGVTDAFLASAACTPARRTQ